MTHKVLEMYVDGTQTIRDATSNEIADMQTRASGAFNRRLEDLRGRRDGLLQSCDWTTLSDCQLTNEQKTTWQTYRQALRDITNGLTTVEDVEAVVFPKKPEA
tara:strand:- start:38 stop:346 length:309 start_codon:yes stop_codon:yes gene_type:complete